MTIAGPNPDGTYTLMPTAEEGQMIAWAVAEHGPKVLVDLLAAWLRDQRAYRAEVEARQLKRGADALTDAEKQQIPPGIRTKLGL